MFLIMFGSISKVPALSKYRLQSETLTGQPANVYEINNYINTDMFDMFSKLPRNTTKAKLLLFK